MFDVVCIKKTKNSNPIWFNYVMHVQIAKIIKKNNLMKNG